MPGSAARSFSRAARTYAGEAKPQREAAQACADRIPAGDYAAALEVGAGTGLLTDALLPRIRCRTYVCLDLSPDMLSVLRESRPEASALVGDAEAPPFRPGSFDLLASASALHWLTEPEKSLPALLGLLRPGGFFSLSLFVAGTLRELAETSASTGFGSVLPLREARFWLDLLKGAGARFEWAAGERTLFFPSAREMLSSLKRTGATHTPAKRPHTRRAYEDFRREYRARFGTARGVPATYSALHAWGRAG